MASLAQEKFIRFGALSEMVGLSRTTIYRLEKQGQFPRRVKLGSNSVAWRMTEISSWMNIK